MGGEREVELNGKGRRRDGEKKIAAYDSFAYSVNAFCVQFPLLYLVLDPGCDGSTREVFFLAAVEEGSLQSFFFCTPSGRCRGQ